MSEYFEFEESGLLFRFPIDALWHIEKSRLYKSIDQNNKIVEFVFCDESKKCWFIEAKTSAPKIENSKKYISDICECFINAASLFAAVRLGFHPGSLNDLPKFLRDYVCNSSDIRLALIVSHPECPQAQLPPFQEALTKLLRPTLKIWGIKSTQVVVYNHAFARRMNWLKPL